MEVAKAVGKADLVWSTLAAHRRRVDASRRAIEQAAKHGRVGVSFSGGKDSTCVVHLVRSIIPDAPVAFFDSGTELESTRELVAQMGAEVIQPRMSMLDMARYAGWWGYDTPTDKECAFDAKGVLIDEPSEAFVVRSRLHVIAHGVRAEESGARMRHATRGELYQGADRTWYLMPVLRWTLQDVWAYIAAHQLPYNRAYDAMTALGVPRESQRVSGLLGEKGSGWGRHAIMRRYEPQRFSMLLKEFPELALRT